MPSRISFGISFFLCIFIAISAHAFPRMGFGYLANQSNDANYEYLETIFPNSFANSIRNIFQVSVIKPKEIDEILKKRELRLEKHFLPYELEELCSIISADYFIYGSFIILPDEMIKINLNLYSKDLNKIFTFTNIGKMETEIFKLVDRITKIMIDFLGRGNFYIAKAVPKGSRLGIITNVSGADLNDLYFNFIKGGYRVASTQGNYPINGIDNETIKCFKNISGTKHSFDIISDKRAVTFLYGTWTGKRYQETIAALKSLYRIYDREYVDNKFASLRRLAALQDIDYLIIIGFNKRRSRAWLRCLDMHSQDLIYMQANVSGSISSICQKIITTMTTKKFTE